jgi:CubicO group peptidase (beta-lactamase class C family)
MRHALAWFLAATFLFDASARGQDTEKPPPDVAKRVDEYLRALTEAGLFSGAVLVARDGQVLIEAAYGDADVAAKTPNTPSTRFKLMSTSKSVTAVAVMRLAQAGKIGLDDPVADRLPGWPGGWKTVTVHQLLDHTSGVPNLENEWAPVALQGKERGLALWRRLAATFEKRALEAPAGTRASYSNFNFVVLGLLVESVSGKPFDEFVRASVLAPAGMKNTGFDDGARQTGLAVGYFRDDDGSPKASVQDMSSIRGAGDVVSTVGDLWRFDRALRGEALLSEATRATMEGTTAASPSYACGWQTTPVEGRRCIHHAGGSNGFVADFLRFPEDDACVVVTSNFAYAPIGRISTDLAAILFGREVPAARRVTRTVLDGHTGVYRHPKVEGRTLLVRRCGDALMLFDVFERVERPFGQSLVPLGDDLFVMPYGDEKVRFTAPSAGKSGYARLESDRGVAAYRRTEPPEAVWRAAARAYAARPDGAVHRIEATDTGLVIHAPDGWPRDLPLVPVTDRLAIALWGPDGGTLLVLDCDGHGVPSGFRWLRNDGQRVTADASR